MARAKKHPSVRARTNRAATAAMLPANPPRRVTPRLPDLGAGREWADTTREWWRELWRSPMSTEYHPTDRHMLFLVALLLDDYWTADSAGMRLKLAAEIRQQAQGFGLTPYARRRLEWQIAETEERKERRQRTAPAAPQPAGGDVDPRSIFSVVP
jgi:hypothetical protein